MLGTVHIVLHTYSPSLLDTYHETMEFYARTFVTSCRHAVLFLITAIFPAIYWFFCILRRGAEQSGSWWVCICLEVGGTPGDSVVGCSRTFTAEGIKSNCWAETNHSTCQSLGKLHLSEK